MRLFFFLAILIFTTSVQASKVALIIDDIGYRQTDEAVLSLPNKITLSVLPHTPLGETLAKNGHQQGHEIMLHIPMQALNGKKLGPGGLTNQMSEYEFKQQIDAAFNSIPYAVGVNNHMGSLLTQLDEPMQWLMENLKHRQGYFIDSVTTRYTRAGAKADHIGIPTLRRQVFLDNDTSKAGLERQFNHLISLAHHQGQVVAIAHPYPETIEFLQNNLSRLKENGIHLVNASELLPYRIAQQPTNSATTRLK
ncbi:divergent polysaccharide deacetylase family protein [Shewanella waksmanii]|uniref:divergent polysaccharide deacetylase family protein n=1 Tax=Shewanella waksmanii TaxID=213783 RepID=UPI003734CEF2